MKLVIRIKHIDKTTSNLQKSPPLNGIYMWSYCEHCREVRENTTCNYKYLFLKLIDFSLQQNV